MANQLTPAEDIKNNLMALQSQFKMALPPHVPVEKFIRVTLTAIQTNNNLLGADRNSLFVACSKAAQDGLMPDGKEAALVPFMSKGVQLVQYMPMVAGILKKVRNSGELASITAQIVYKNDQFNFWIDSDGEHIEHTPLIFGERGEAIGAYALAKTKDGATYIEVMTAKDVDAIRNSSKAKDSGPWAGAFVFEMWKKSAIRRLSKRLPMSSDLEHTIHSDDDFYSFQEPTPEEVKSAAADKPEKKKEAGRLKKMMNKEKTVSQSEPIDVTPVQEVPPETVEPLNTSENIPPTTVPDQDIPI